MLVTVLTGVLVTTLNLAAAGASDYAGASACKSCHPVEFAAQSGTAHARALAAPAANRPGEWAFGAGVQAITFVRRLDAEYYLEEAESWYRAIDSYARTPGHTDGRGIRDRIFDPSAAILRCFACHSTGPLTVAADGRIQPYEPGIHCEICHGPSATHARNPGAVRPPNPAELTADAINRFCGECHRMPASAGATTNLRDPWNARHQPLMLAASRCFRESKGRLTCFTCHLPHLPLEGKLAVYDGACGRCHSGVKHKTGIQAGACVACHMPRAQAQAYLKFANHRIAIYAQGDPMNVIASH